MYDFYDNLPIDVDMIISNAASWVCAGTGLTNGSVLPGMVGYEADHVFNPAPAGISVIAHSPVRTFGFSDMATYSAGKSTVFATGSMQWSFGLDDTDYRPRGRLNAAVQQMTRNVLARFAGTTVPLPASLISAVGPPGSVNTDYTDYAGMQIQTGATSQTLTQLGFWCQPADLASHFVKMTSNRAGNPDLFAPVSIKCDGVPGFHYANVPGGITLAANTTYFLLAKGPPYFNPMSVLPTSIASITRAVSVLGSTYYPQSTPNMTYGPLDLKVKVPAQNSNSQNNNGQNNSNDDR
jgi:hypothetical protein